MSYCALHEATVSSANKEGEGVHCIHCVLAENHDLAQQLKLKEHAIRILEERKHEAFFFLLMFFCKVYQSSCARMRRIQETIVKNNNYNIKVREERPSFLQNDANNGTGDTDNDSNESLENRSNNNYDDENNNDSSETNNINDTNNNNQHHTPQTLSHSHSLGSTSSYGSNNSLEEFEDEPIQSSAGSSSTSINTNMNLNLNLDVETNLLSALSGLGSPSSPPSPAVTPLPSPHFPPPSIIANTHNPSESSLIKHFHHIIYENALDPVLVHDTEGWIVDANGAAVALTGYSIEELRQKNIRELESRYVEPDPKIIEQLMKGAAFRIYGEHVTKQGKVFPVEVHISLATVEGKNYVVGLFRDMTEILRAKALEKANEVAQATNRAKNIFLATMSHELTTPLYGVVASLDILKQSPALTEKQLDLLDCAMNSAVILKGIVNDILDLSVLDLGMFRIAKEPFSFTQCTTSSFSVFMEAAKFQGLSLKWLHDDMEVVHVPRHPITPIHSSYSYSFPRSSNQQTEWSKLPSFHVLGDSKRLQQVLVNLLSNAIKFTPRGGSVILRTHITSEDEKSVKLRIDVADTGIGLPADQLHRIFEKFTQAEEGFTRKYSGTGLGLYISNKLVLLMGGKLAVKSEVQKGTVFTLDIRLMKHPGPLPHLTRTADIELPPLIAAMAAYHRFGKKKQKIYRLPSFSRGRTTDLHKSGSDKLSRNTIFNIDKLQNSNKSGVAKEGDESTTSTESPKFSEDAPENTLSVLLVEDNLVNQKVGKQLLRTLGIRDIDIANDGSHCLEMIRARRRDKPMYNVILMDKQMPFLDGMEATRAIRKQEVEEGHPRTVIIALTADCRAGVDQEVISAGMDDYLTKPVRANSLYNVFLKHGLLPR